MKEEEITLLSSPLSDAAPGGDNLEYDPRMSALEEAMAGEPERAMGDSVIPASPPDWRQVEKDALVLLRETRDVRIAVFWSIARLANRGIAGLHEGLSLIAHLFRRMWDTCWPIPDDGDVQERISALMLLSPLPGSFDADTTVLHLLLEVPLTSSAMLGRYSLKDWHGARDGSDAARTITAALRDTKPEDTAELSALTEGCLDAIKSIRDAFTEHNQGAPDFRMLTDLLKEIHLFLGSAAAGAVESVPAEASPTTVAPPAAAPDSPQVGSPPAVPPAGLPVARPLSPGNARAGRQEAIRLMQQVCDWFVENEPSSPVPFFLQRAIRSVGANLVDIVSDIAPSSMDQLRSVLKPSSPAASPDSSQRPSSPPTSPQPSPPEAPSDEFFSPFG